MGSRGLCAALSGAEVPHAFGPDLTGVSGQAAAGWATTYSVSLNQTCSFLSPVSSFWKDAKLWGEGKFLILPNSQTKTLNRQIKHWITNLVPESMRVMQCLFQNKAAERAVSKKWDSGRFHAQNILILKISSFILERGGERIERYKCWCPDQESNQVLLVQRSTFSHWAMQAARIFPFLRENRV